MSPCLRQSWICLHVNSSWVLGVLLRVLLFSFSAQVSYGCIASFVFLACAAMTQYFTISDGFSDAEAEQKAGNAEQEEALHL